LPWDSFSGLFAEGALDPRNGDRLRAYDRAVVYSRDASLARNIAHFVPLVVEHDPRPPDDGPHASLWLASCLQALGVGSMDVPVPVLRPSPEDSRRADAILHELPPRFLAIHPGSGSHAKNWPSERFAAVVRATAAEKWLLVRGPADDDAVGSLEGVPGQVIACDLPLRVLAAVLARAGAYVGNDSGVTHLAAAAGAPTVALFGPTDPRLWSPVGPRVTVIAGATMEAISVHAVVAALAEAFAAD
jgi:ADP-heptose:LPS heptosyltransferase